MSSRLLGDIGTIEWGRRTRGLMSPAQRLRYMSAMMLETARSLPRLLLARAGVGRVLDEHLRQGFLHSAPARFRAHAQRVPTARANAALSCGFATALRSSLFYGAEWSLSSGAKVRANGHDDAPTQVL
jgi:hypothetical protein